MIIGKYDLLHEAQPWIDNLVFSFISNDEVRTQSLGTIPSGMEKKYHL